MRALALLLLIAAGGAAAQVQVNPYMRQDGTYVAPHVRSAPNSTQLDNYGTRGNVNPYSGQMGTQTPQYMPNPRASQYAPAAPSCYTSQTGRVVCR